MKRKRISVIIIMALFAVTMFSGFTNYNGIGQVSYESKQTIAPSTTYTYLMGSNAAAGGIVQAHVIDAAVTSGIIKPYVYNGQVRSTSTVSNMGNVIANGSYTVVAGVNGDIYDTATGTPKGAVIHEGVLYTGGYQSGYLLSFDGYGNPSVSNQTIYYTLDYQKYVTTESAEGAEPVVTIENAVKNIGYFNVPHGGANELHAFNSRYAGTTKTSGTCVEAVLTLTSGTQADLRVGQTVEATVTSVNAETSGTAIAANQIVLSAKNNSSAYSDICAMVPGTTAKITVSTEESSPINNAQEAMGVYNILAYNGAVWTADKTLNPRTCIGIKPDGNIVLYVVDGRQTASKGMNAVDITSYLMSLGCVTVVNMDGGGSTTMIARSTPGINDNSSIVNSPSDGSQRSVTNGLFLVYADTQDTNAARIAVYPVNSIMLPGTSVQLSSYGVNSMYEKAQLSEPVSYMVDTNYGTVSASGVFTAGKTAGIVGIYASAGSVLGQASVQIVDDVTFNVNRTSLTLKPGESFDFNISNVKYGLADVIYADSCFDWSCSNPDIGSINSEGLFTATIEKGDFSGNIVVKLGSKSITIPVAVRNESQFVDVSGHWAKEYIINLTDEGIVNGMTATTFEPDGSLTRAQFLTMLSKMDYAENLSVGTVSNFTDVKADDWFYSAVNWGVANGIVNGMGDGTFAPNAKVSREQMSVMLYNYYTYKKLTWDGAEKDLTFTDNNKMSAWAVPAIKKIVNENIMSGRPDGTFDPLGNATRGEAAKIIYIVKEIFYFETTN